MPETTKSSSDNDRAWLEVVAIALFGLLKEHFFSIIFWSLAICIAYVVFDKLTLPLVHPYYKNLLGFEALLTEMKTQLEKGIPADKQDNPKILKAYLDLYATFRELRAAAKRDHNERIDRQDRRWLKFERIKLPEHAKLRQMRHL